MPKAILLVDDDLQVLRSLEKLLMREGHVTTCASSGKEALEWVEKKDFDLIVVDIRMPDLDGVDTVKKIREVRTNKNQPNIPVVFLTGYSDMVAIDRAKQYGEVILKPFNLDEFLSHVKQEIAKGRLK